MKKYIMFYRGQLKLKSNKWKYEPNTKYLVTEEDENFYYINANKFNKANINKDFSIGNIIQEHSRVEERAGQQ